MIQFPFALKHVFSYSGTLTPAEMIGPVPDDIRANFYVTGGDVWLPDGTMIGKLRPVGADWLTVRRDNVGLLDARATVEMNDGALLYIVYNGFMDLGPNGYESVSRGEWPKKVRVRAAPRVTTSSPAHAWLNGTQLFNVGEVDFTLLTARYDVYVAE